MLVIKPERAPYKILHGLTEGPHPQFRSAQSYASSKFYEREPLTLERIKMIVDSFPPEPIEEWMIEQGFDPEKGGRLLLPLSYRDMVGPHTPYYVNFSKETDKPYLWQCPQLKDWKPYDYENARPNVL